MSDVFAFPMHLELKSLPQMSRQELMMAQQDNAATRRAIRAVKEGRWPKENKSSPSNVYYKKEMGKLMLKDGLLHRLSKQHSARPAKQIPRGRT